VVYRMYGMIVSRDDVPFVTLDRLDYWRLVIVFDISKANA
jgi:hypothetical protein